MPRRRSRRRRRKGSPGPLLRALSVVLMAVAIVAALTLFFKVEKVVVSGNSRYTEAEILAVTGVETGDNLILLDKYHIAQRLYTDLPYITNVRINRKLPDVLMVEVTETKAVASIEGAGAWWLISARGKILEAVDAAAAEDYTRLENMTAESPAAGEYLRLAEGEKLTTERLLELLAGIESRDMFTRMDNIDAGDPDKLVLGYDGRFQVEMYYDADFDFKLSCLAAAVAELEPNETGILRMTMKDDNEVRLIPFQQGQG